MLKITCVCIILFYSKFTPHILRNNEYQFGDLFPMLRPVSMPRYILFVALFVFSMPIQILCLCIVHRKKHFALLRETMEIFWAGFSVGAVS